MTKWSYPFLKIWINIIWSGGGCLAKWHKTQTWCNYDMVFILLLDLRQTIGIIEDRYDADAGLGESKENIISTGIPCWCCLRLTKLILNNLLQKYWNYHFVYALFHFAKKQNLSQATTFRTSKCVVYCWMWSVWSVWGNHFVL